MEQIANYSLPCVVCGTQVAMFVSASSAVPTVAFCKKHSPDKAEPVLANILQEYLNASRKFPPFNSAHEGFAVLKEEVDELWDEVKGNKKDGAKDRMRMEATQVAAMALRFLVDVCGGK